MNSILNWAIILFGLILSIFQIGVVASWGALGMVNLNVLALIILIILRYDEESLWWLGISGIMLDIYSPFRFGVNILWLIALWLIVQFIIRKYLSKSNFWTITILSVGGLTFFNLPALLIFGGWSGWLISLPLVIAIANLFFTIMIRLLPKKEKFTI